MSGQVRRTTSHLMKELEEHAPRFSFIQVIRLLRIFLDHKGKTEDLLREHVFVEPLVSLAFPGTDVYELRKKDEKYVISATFLGLYGPSSPLPVYYTEEIINEHLDEKSVKKDFLDIFNHPFYELFVRIWNKYRVWLKILDEKNDEAYRFVFSFLGLDAVNVDHQKDRDFLRYAPLFSQRPRSAPGLRSIVADFLHEKKVKLEQCLRHKIRIAVEQRCCLGSGNCSLGIDATIGEEIETRNLRVKLVAGPLKQKEFLRAMPGFQGFRKLKRYIRLYLEQSLICTLHPVLRPEDAKPLSPGSQWSLLGVNTLLYQPGEYKGDLEGIWAV